MISNILIGLVALLHLYFLWFEMFAWESRGPKVFRSFPKNLFAPTRSMAANQGLYNGFLAAGLIWAFFIGEPVWRDNVALFFLGCVLVAALYGAATVERKIFFVQGVPAVLGVVAVLVGW